jgi:hypothetical protein
MNNDFQLQESFLKKLVQMYITFDSSLIVDYLAEDFVNSSMWVLSDITSKKEYLTYLSDKLRTMAKNHTNLKFCIMYDQRNGRPYLVCNQKTPEGGFGAFEATDLNGKIKSLALMPASFYPLKYRDKQAYDTFICDFERT